MILPGQSLLLVEMMPALFAAYAANEAERVAPKATLVDCQMIGASGRLFMAGEKARARDGAGAYRQGAEEWRGGRYGLQVDLPRASSRSLVQRWPRSGRAVRQASERHCSRTHSVPHAPLRHRCAVRLGRRDAF